MGKLLIMLSDTRHCARCSNSPVHLLLNIDLIFCFAQIGRKHAKRSAIFLDNAVCLIDGPSDGSMNKRRERKTILANAVRAEVRGRLSRFAQRTFRGPTRRLTNPSSVR